MARRHVCLVLARLCLGLGAVACASASPSAYLTTEADFLRVGVDRDAERAAVVRTLAQRRLSVRDEQISSGYVALSASSSAGTRTAVRVITARGVVLAEDADLDELLDPARVLLARVPNPFGEMELVGALRVARGQDRGCLSLYRVLSDGSLARVELDVSALGSRACVMQIDAGARGRLLAEVGWPTLALGAVPHLEVVLSFGPERLGRGQEEPLRARIDISHERLERLRTGLTGKGAGGLSFDDRQALGLARAAVMLLAERSVAQQVGSYREVMGGYAALGPEADLIQATVAHIEKGWLDEEEAAPEQAAPQTGAASDAAANERAANDAGASEGAAPELLIEPEAREGEQPASSSVASPVKDAK